MILVGTSKKSTRSPPGWPDLAKFRQFSKHLEIFGNILKVYLIFGKVVNPCLEFFVCFWAEFHRCKLPNIEKTIWSHWSPLKKKKKKKKKK